MFKMWYVVHESRHESWTLKGNEMETKKMTFMQACRDYFGLLPGQSAMDLGREVKALSEADRKEISEGLMKQGYELILAPGATS